MTKHEAKLEQKVTADDVTKSNETQILLSYRPRQIQAQKLMAGVFDPETGEVLKMGRVAELCRITRTTLHRWINDNRYGGKVAWYKAVHGYVISDLHKAWPHLVKVQQREALFGKAKIGAFRNVAKLLGYMGPDIEIDAPTNNTYIGKVIVKMPDNGRRKTTSPDRPGRLKRQLEPSEN